MHGLLAISDTLSRARFDITGAHWIVGLVSGLVALVCVLVHYEVMSFTSRWIATLRDRRRSRILVLLVAILVAQVVEVWIFALTYWGLDRFEGLGHISGEFSEGALDFVFFSVTAYSSLGFSDLVPEGPIRILAGTEVLVGLTIITWSASITFLEMQRDWKEFRGRR